MEEANRVLPELDFELWRESPTPGPRIFTRPLTTGVGAKFDGHVIAENETWAMRGVLRPHPVSGLLRVESITVEPHGDAGEVTGKVLRALNLASIRDEAASMLRFLSDQPQIFFASRPDAPLRVFPDSEQPVRDRLVVAAQRKSRRGRPSMSDEQLQKAADVYLTFYGQGVKRGLMKQVAARLGIAEKTAADRVAKARQAGFLTPAPKGRAGALPGPRLPHGSGGRLAPSPPG